MKTATFVKVMEGFTGEAALFKLSEPIEYCKPYDEEDPPARTTHYVVVSATYAMFSGPETFMFPADKNGKILDWMELEGSRKGVVTHTQVLANAGYTALGV